MKDSQHVASEATKREQSNIVPNAPNQKSSSQDRRTLVSLQACKLKKAADTTVGPIAGSLAVGSKAREMSLITTRTQPLSQSLPVLTPGSGVDQIRPSVGLSSTAGRYGLINIVKCFGLSFLTTIVLPMQGYEFISDEQLIARLSLEGHR